MLDWDDLRFFLAVPRSRTLAAAAKNLGVTQSTVGRRLSSMQESLGVGLLHRSVDGYVLTAAGESVLAHVERVERETQSVEQAVAGYDTRVAGTVRVLCSQLLASHLLAPSFSALQTSHPGITIESYTGLPGDALSTRDVDVALRMQEFEQGDLIVRKLGYIAMGVYACVSYIAKHGEPLAENCFTGHRLIGPLESTDTGHASWIASYAGQGTIIMRTDSFETRFWAAYSGAGIAILPVFMADREPVLRRVEGLPSVPPNVIWQGIQSESKMTTRVRLVLDCIADAARSRADLLDPKDRLAE